MNTVQKLAQLLPKYEEIQNLLQNEPEAGYILRLATTDMLKLQVAVNHPSEEAAYLVCALVDKSWERIHTGHFSEVPLEIRKIYALANLFKIFYLLYESVRPEQVERCSELLDKAMLIGCTQDLYANSNSLQQQLTDYFNDVLSTSTGCLLPVLTPQKRKLCPCDIPTLDCPSVDDFQHKCFLARQPSLLLNTIQHCPALTKWLDLNYLLKVAGTRTVPIEIGSNYATDEWSQQLIKIRDFLKRQFGQQPQEKKTTEIEYLAQHELFDQIPALKADICIPDYCSIRENAEQSAAPISIKAWLGPKGTISPLHYDPQHNLLCQVFGSKYVLLAAPADTPNLYAHESAMLGNTSRIDAAAVDYVQFPLAAKVRFYEVHLQAGDCLYMPPKWWHYVRAESESFSVSFWWM